ncbi:hypothetical protein LRH25_12990 [Ideonella azotifigens]|uniref:Lipoprotein n=1 Tax=Ideonella azotifigens TaxID=513160 RepID=A0ABP3V986_9BURK|nr:hypothetical protein [Ideonella azotifigens]
MNMFQKVGRVLGLTLALTVAACGGGGGGDCLAYCAKAHESSVVQGAGGYPGRFRVEVYTP